MADLPTPPHAHPTLEYAPRPPVRRKWIVRLITIVLIVAAGLGVYRWRGELAQWYSLVRLRHAALTHRAAPSTVIVTQLPTDTFHTWAGTLASRYAPVDASWLQIEWRLVPRLGAGPGSDRTVFLHERRTPSGQRRVVAVHHQGSWFAEGHLLDFTVRLFEPGTLLRPQFRELTVKENPDLRIGHNPAFPWGYVTLGWMPWGSDFRLHAGQPRSQQPVAILSRLCLQWQSRHHRVRAD